MSHQVRQISSTRIESLEILRRAVSSVHIPELKTNLFLNTDLKQARYYGNYMDTCDAVITYARPLTDIEKGQHYEIAVKRGEEEVDGRKIPVFNLFADTHASDRAMGEKLSKVFEEYEINMLSDVAAQNGAISCEEVTDAGQFEIPSGYRCVRITTPN